MHWFLAFSYLSYHARRWAFSRSFSLPPTPIFSSRLVQGSPSPFLPTPSFPRSLVRGSPVHTLVFPFLCFPSLSSYLPSVFFPCLPKSCINFSWFHPPKQTDLYSNFCPKICVWGHLTWDTMDPPFPRAKLPVRIVAVLLHLSIQSQIFVECKPCSWHHVRYWAYQCKQKQTWFLLPWGLLTSGQDRR